MALQSSGAISLNEIHVEAGGGSGSQASINDSDIRGLISKASGAQMSFSEWYGASSTQTIGTTARFSAGVSQYSSFNFGTLSNMAQGFIGNWKFNLKPPTPSDLGSAFITEGYMDSAMAATTGTSTASLSAGWCVAWNMTFMYPTYTASGLTVGDLVSFRFFNMKSSGGYNTNNTWTANKSELSGLPSISNFNDFKLSITGTSSGAYRECTFNPATDQSSNSIVSHTASTTTNAERIYTFAYATGPATLGRAFMNGTHEWATNASGSFVNNDGASWELEFV